jgi:hypothetical protein
MSEIWMESCPQFSDCSANLCPRHEGIAKTTWFIGEPVCTAREHQGLGWVKRQKVLNRKRPPSLMDVLLSYQDLVDSAPKKRVLSPEARTRLVEMGRRYHFEKKACPTGAFGTLLVRGG